MYFLLEDKSAPSYNMALSILKSHCPDFNSEIFMVDFEKAEHSAIRSHFPNSEIRGCLFHFKQCLMRKFKNVAGYSENELMKSDLHSVYGIPFLPLNNVVTGWNAIKQILTQYPATATFITYFEANWMNIEQPPISSCNVELLSQHPI